MPKSEGEVVRRVRWLCRRDGAEPPTPHPFISLWHATLSAGKDEKEIFLILLIVQ
jgi:hypothetical protein